MRGISRATLLLSLVVVAALAALVAHRAGQRIEAPPAIGVPDVAKPKPVATGFQGCPPEGDGGDPALNRLKNRTDSARFVPVSIDAVLALPWPAAVERRRRAEWSRADAARVARSEGTPVSVEGYLVGAKEEGPESPNCHGADAGFRDWHLWLAGSPGRDRSRSVVVEATPVIRARHPAWSLRAIRRLVRDGDRVRVGGWLLLDPEHPDQVGRTRGTIWEIHPIMAIEVRRGGRWVPLDALP